MASEPARPVGDRDGDEGDDAGAPAVKICGLCRREDVVAAAEAGASFLGQVFAPSPRRVPSPSRSAELLEGVPAAAAGVFVDAPPVEVVRTAEAVPLDVVQLHGSESPELCASLRGGGLRVWKAIRPESRAELEQAVARYGPVADGLLVEGYSEEAAGGTGTAFPHEWWEGAGLDELSGADGPALILAGGLTPENVGEALERTTPRVVDVSSGVEREPGVKDPRRIRDFVRAVRDAGRAGKNGGDASGPSGRAAGAGEGA